MARPRTCCFIFALLAAGNGWAWTEYGGPGGRHYSALTQIDSTNVEQPELAWSFQTGDLASIAPQQRDKTSFQSTPIKLPDHAGGHLALCTSLSRVVALDPITGAQRWAFDPEIDRTVARPYNCRGLAYWEREKKNQFCEQRIYIATHDRRLVALDSRTGKTCTIFGKAGEVDLQEQDNSFPRGDVTHPSPPLVVNNSVIVGSGVVDFAKAVAPPGTVQAFDAQTGRALWTFHTVPKIESDKERWPGQPQTVSGAANVWAPMSADSDRDLLFLPTSAPSPDYYGARRPGNNGYANSVVALRASTGEVVWHYQIVHHDLWDYDMPAQPILTDLLIDDVLQPAVIQLTKQGFVFALHRETGKPLWPVEERAVPQQSLAEEMPAPTQPFPLLPAPLLPADLTKNDAWGLTPWDKGRCRKLIDESRHFGLFTPITSQWTLMLPGSLGGPNWGGAGIDPIRNLLVVNYSTVASRARLVARAGAVEQGEVSIEGYNWRMVMSGTPYDMEVGMLISPLGMPCTAPPWGKLAALDLSSGEWLWQKPLGSVHDMAPMRLPFHINWGTPNLGGGIITASGLFFIAATTDKLLRAFDSTNGEMLWHAELPVDALATPMTYMANGRQYVVVAAGGHHMFEDRPKGDYLQAFALPGAHGE
ncbi:MAG: pyrroloquinoline quinone-dependent dehydrogenase [Pseudomonadales bacterium]